MKTKNLNIIITEDDPDDRLLILEALKENDWTGDITFAEDGEYLMQELHKRKKNKNFPVLILLDLNMPRKDGRQALEEIKNDKELKHIPVLILTTSNSKDDILCSYQSGSNTYFTKPSKFSELSEIIRNIKDYWSEKATQLL